MLERVTIETGGPEQERPQDFKFPKPESNRDNQGIRGTTEIESSSIDNAEELALIMEESPDIFLKISKLNPEQLNLLNAFVVPLSAVARAINLEVIGNYLDQFSQIDLTKSILPGESVKGPQERQAKASAVAKEIGKLTR